MSKAKLRWPSALSALVAVTAELICDAVCCQTTHLIPQLFLLLLFLLCSFGVFFSFSMPYLFCKPMLQWQVPKPPYSKTEPHLRQLNKNTVLNNCWWAVPSIEAHNSCSCQCFEKQKTFYTLAFRHKHSRKYAITVQCVCSTFHTMVHNGFSRRNSAKSLSGQSLWLILDLILVYIQWM